MIKAKSYEVLFPKDILLVKIISTFFLELLTSSKATNCDSCKTNIEQENRLPLAYFVPSQFGKDAILKNEIVFSSKK